MKKLTLGLSGLSRRSRIVVAATIVTCMALGIIVYASIPAPGGVIHGCYKRSSGALRVIDDAVTQCDNNEAPINWSQSRLLTTGSGNTTTATPIVCGGTNRSLSFTKQSDTSRLRITYKDQGFVEIEPGSAHEFSMRVLIDGSDASPTPINSLNQGDDENIAVVGSAMTFGYAEGISAGTHTITTQYLSGPEQCFRIGAYTIEVEEIP